MNFDSYSSRLSDLTEYYTEFLTKPNPVSRIEQKRFQIVNESMQMKTVSTVIFGQLNDKSFIFQMVYHLLPMVIRPWKK